MSQNKGGNEAAICAGSPAVGSGNPYVKGGISEGPVAGKSGTSLDQLNHDMAAIDIGFGEESVWEVIAKKSRNQAIASNAKPWGSSTVTPNAWGHSERIPAAVWGSNNGDGRNPGNNWAQAVDSCKLAGRVNPNPQKPNSRWEAAYMIPPHVVSPPLQHGCQGANRGGFTGTHPKTQEESASVRSGEKYSLRAYASESGIIHEKMDNASDDDDLLADSDDDISDDYDSDVSEKSHETRKKNKWLKPLFEVLDNLKEEQINDPNRQWHCPACHDGPGAIGWYRGVQRLMTHAKTKGNRRIKLHRELAALLDEELRRRGISVVPADEVFGKWQGLCETTANHEIVWPPMVVIMNTLLEKDENDEWIGMGNQELVDYFSHYAAVKACHSHGPNGHCGMSVLIFEASAMGYLEAERLHKQFADKGRDRDGWERHRLLFYPDGKRELYGFLANKEDIDSFNQHSAGKPHLKFDMKSYQEMTVAPMQQMSEDNQKLTWYKDRAVKHELLYKAFEESFGVASQKLRETIQENRIVRVGDKMQHEEIKEEMNFLKCFFNEEMDKIHKAIVEKEDKFDTLLQEELSRQSHMDSGTNEDRGQRKEETECFISRQVKGVREFEAKREKLIRAHEQKKVDLKRKQLKEEIELEKEFHTVLSQLIEEHTPSASRLL